MESYTNLKVIEKQMGFLARNRIVYNTCFIILCQINQIHNGQIMLWNSVGLFILHKSVPNSLL